MLSDKETKKPRVGLLGASFGTDNMGVNALTSGTLKAFYSRYPEGEMFLFDYGKKEATYRFQMENNIIPVKLLNIRFSKRFYLKNNIAFLIMLAIMTRIIPVKRLRKKLISRNFWLNRIAEADFVASMAGGDSFSDIYGLGRFFYVALPQILALAIGKRIVILPQTIGPFYGKIASIVARYILNRAYIIYSRDYESLESARNMLNIRYGNNDLRFCYDVGFILDAVRPKSGDVSIHFAHGKELPLVGLNISGLLYMGGYSQSNMFELKVDYKELVYDIIDNFVSKKHASVMLVPHVFGTHAESDFLVCEKVYEEVKDRYGKQLSLVSGKYNQSEIKHIIGKCDFFIGSRMHACIAALSQNIPTVSIAYSKKFTGVMHTIGINHLVADPRTIDKWEILKIIDDAFEERVHLKRHLEETIPYVQEKILTLFADMDSPVRK